MVAPFKSYSKYARQMRFWRTPDGRFIALVSYEFHAQGVTQKPPFVNTAYFADVMRSSSGAADAGSWSVTPGEAYGTKIEATNRARAKFVEAIGEASQLGSTLTSEFKSTYGTVVGGAVSLLQSARAVRKGNLVEAARLIGIAPPKERTRVTVKTLKSGRKVTISREVLALPSGREVVRSAGSKWLWWSYGIKPLVSDMYNAMDVLQRELPYAKVEGYGASSYVFKNGPLTHVCKSKIRITADVRVINPNLFLANQLGLTNPVQWLNEGIPFSFVVDWFSNLSQVISQMTDFVGLEIANPITAEKSTIQETYVWWGATDVKDRTILRRDLSIPEAKLRFAYERFSPLRGANAVSLLVQFLQKK